MVESWARSRGSQLIDRVERSGKAIWRWDEILKELPRLEKLRRNTFVLFTIRMITGGNERSNSGFVKETQVLPISTILRGQYESDSGWNDS
nr:hypothetical protein Iba_chr07aCG7580 [Ipomoea batatas]